MNRDFLDKTPYTLNINVDSSTLEYMYGRMLHVEQFQQNYHVLDTFTISSDIDTKWPEAISDDLKWDIVWRFRMGPTSSVHQYLVRSSDPDLRVSIGVTQNQKSLWGTILCDKLEDADKVREILHKCWPASKLDLDVDNVPIRFWTYSSDGPTSRVRKVDALKWPEIKGNYTPKVSSMLTQISEARPPFNQGKILLWHGVPGTGKSSAIRSIIHSWLPWCDVSYVIDPEIFFGTADYMMDVVLDTYHYDPYDWDDDEYEVATPEQQAAADSILKEDERWKLLIIEDADEFIRADAKERTGQALSRLLNLGDGLIGQGLKYLVLITTNETLGNVHKAVSREGRCLANVEFKPFSPVEAKQWLTDRQLEFPPYAKTSDEHTLAQLYEYQRKQGQIHNRDSDFVAGVYL